MLRYRHIVRVLQRRSYSASSANPTSPPPTSGGDSKDSVDPDDKHPIRRTFRLLGNDMRKIKQFFVPKDPIPEDLSERSVFQSKFNFAGDKTGLEKDEFQTHCDVLVIGGGGVGSSIAYWLKEKARDGLNVVVVEKDDTYSKSSLPVSVGGLCPQFSLPENIEMSLFAAEFFRQANEQRTSTSQIPFNFTPHGHLMLASTEEEAEALKQTSNLQNELGARNELLTPVRLASRFPWLNTQGITLACHGLEKEGTFDSWALLAFLRQQATGYGAHYVNGETVDFVFKNQPDITVVADDSASYNSLDQVVIQLKDGTRRSVKFALCVIAAGASSEQVGRLAQIGLGPGMLRIPLPIARRKRYMYAISTQAPNAPAMGMPIIVDSSGTFIRRDGLGGNYICGQDAIDQDPNGESDEIDSSYFEQQIRPKLRERIPAFESASIVESWTGFYGYNVFDDNGILGPHPYYHNLYLATGFSGHGMQHSLAVGRAISELIMDGQFRTIDLSRLTFDRLIVDRPMHELNNILS